VLCHSVLSHNRTFSYRTNSDNKITDVESREEDDNRSGDVLHFGGQSGNYRGSKEFVYNCYHDYQR
jgi:hypothetical protein